MMSFFGSKKIGYRNVPLREKRFFLRTALFVAAIGFLVFTLKCNSSSRSLSQGATKTPVQSSAVPQARALIQQLSDAFETASAQVSRSVVSIYAEQIVQVQNPFGMPDDAFKDFFGEDFFKRFFGEPQTKEQKQTVRSLGSGVIVTKDGYILTNNHVVEKADKLSVVIGDKKTYKARVIGADPPTDVAVVKIDADNMPFASLGNSDEVKVGQWVIAVGNPFQLMHTVTAGIISAKGRSSVGLADYEDFIQTDASINPGNSGGALADLDGQVIGINTAIESPSGGSIGIGFAIPINMAKQVMGQLIAKGKITRGYLDLIPQDIGEDLAKALKLRTTQGALVAQVTPGGPADKAGIKQGDVIVAFNGQPISDSTELRNMVAQMAPGTSLKITLMRNGSEKQVTAVLGERPKSQAKAAPREEQPKETMSKKLGLSVQILTPDIAQQLGYKGEQGVVVTDIVPGSAADDAGLARGDLIKEVNRVEIRTVNDFEKAVRSLKNGDAAALLVRRGQGTLYVAITVR
jgi:serine protease Do